MQLKLPTRSRSSGSSEDEMGTELQEAMTDAIRESDDKIIEIRPANTSRGRGKFSLIALIGVVIAVGYWLRKSQRPTDKLQRAASETADRTKHVTEQAADRIQERGETVAERVEEESQHVSEQVEQTGETVAEETEKVGEKAAENEDESGQSSIDSSVSS